MFFTRLLLTASIVLGGSVSVYAQEMLTLEEYTAKKINAREIRVQEKYPDFRFVKAVEDFPERPKAKRLVKVDSHQEKVIATLHHKRTGLPLESCVTPCAVHVRSARQYILTLYKDGHLPVLSRFGPMNWSDVPHKYNLRT